MLENLNRLTILPLKRTPDGFREQKTFGIDIDLSHLITRAITSLTLIIFYLIISGCFQSTYIQCLVMEFQW